MLKNPPANAGDARNAGSIPGWRRSPEVGNDNLLQYSCLENSMDGGAWQSIVHGVRKSWTRLSACTHTHTHTHTHVLPKACACCALSLSCVPLFATLWTTVHQSPLSNGFSRQEYWSGLPCPPPGDRPNTGIKPRSPALQVDSLQMGYQGSPPKAYNCL